MRTESKRTELLVIPADAVRDKAVGEQVHAIRAVRCMNLRPVCGPDGRTLLQGVGRPRRLSTTQLEYAGVLPWSGGGDAIVLWREPELWVLAPDTSEAVCAGSIEGTLLNATLCGNRLIVNSSEGVWQVVCGDGGAELRRVPAAEDYHGISLRAVHGTVLRATVASRKLQREYLPGETVPDGADARRLGSDIGEAYERLCATARGQGSRIQPALVRYRVYDREMHELYCSAPVLLSHPEGVQCSGANTLRSLDRRKVESYELTAQTWRVELDIPAGLPEEAAYVTVYASPQFHPYDPAAACAVSLSRSEGTGNEFGHIMLPGPDSMGALLRQGLRALAALERPAASYSIGAAARTVTVESGAPEDVRAEIKAVAKAWNYSGVEADELLRRVSAPNSFTARCGCAGPAAMLWGGVRVRRYSGYPMGQFAAQTTVGAWRGWIKVNFADGSSVLWSGGGDSGAPGRLNPVLSYPSADAVNMVIGLECGGAAAKEQSFTLVPDPVSGQAAYIHDSMMPFELNDAEDGLTATPEVKSAWTDYPDTLLLAAVGAPLTPRAVCSQGKGAVNALATAGSSQSAWDFGRSRFYAFCNGGILALNSTEQLTRVAATPVDSRVCRSGSAVTVADGNVWAVASGDLIRLHGNRAVSERKDCGYTAVAWRGPQRELLGLQADGGIEVTAFDYGMCRFMLDYRLSAVKLHPANGRLAILTSAEGIYNLAEESDSRLLDVEWVVNLTHRRAAATRLHGIVAGMAADRFSGTVALSRRNGERVAPAADMGLIVKGEIRSAVGSRMIGRPARGWQLRIAGNASNITISEVRISYEEYTGDTERK